MEDLVENHDRAVAVVEVAHGLDFVEVDGWET